MNVSIKKGSVVTIPVLAGMAIMSDAPPVLSVKMQGTSVLLTALAPGSAHLTLSLAADLSVTLLVTVTS